MLGVGVRRPLALRGVGGRRGRAERREPTPDRLERHRRLVPGPTRDPGRPCGRRHRPPAARRGPGSAAPIRLNAVRAPLYAEAADVVTYVDELVAAAVAERIIDAMDARRQPPTPPTHRRPRVGPGRGGRTRDALSVDLAERAYLVLVGPGTRHEVTRLPPAAKRPWSSRSSRSSMPAGWRGSTPGCPSRCASSPRARTPRRSSRSKSWPASSPTPACRGRTW